MDKIAIINVLDLQVPVYYDSEGESSHVCWRVRNPDVGYKGILYYNYEIGEVTYPEGACMPLQTDYDIQIVPQFVISDTPIITDDMMCSIKATLYKEFKLRNRKTLI